MNFSFKSNKGKITINEQDYVGGNMYINGDKVIIDGEVVMESLVGDINITVHGDVNRLETGSGNATVYGNVETASTMSGDLFCEVVNGNAKTMSGDINSKVIHGKAKTMSGDINYK